MLIQLNPAICQLLVNQSWQLHCRIEKAKRNSFGKECQRLTRVASRVWRRHHRRTTALLAVEALNPQCIAEKAKYDLRDLTGEDFNRIVFAGASDSEMRSPSDAFTLDEMEIIHSSEARKHWSTIDKDFLWFALEHAYESME